MTKLIWAGLGENPPKTKDQTVEVKNQPLAKGLKALCVEASNLRNSDGIFKVGVAVWREVLLNNHFTQNPRGDDRSRK
jgi:hypothetical protein